MNLPEQGDTQVEESLARLLKGKTVLITGGTGFLGRNLIEKLLTYDVQSIRVFSRDEVKHHRVAEKFQHHPKLRFLIGDIRDYARLKRACGGVDYVIHAAALKRVDLLEYNVEESIKTNVIGTLNIVQACLDCDIEKAIFISSDKACAPVNSYGACKFVSERIFTESNYSRGKSRTVFTSVRYGNVLESTGSVIPFFEKKIRDGEDIPLTDERMTRFIISPGQAVTLVMNALVHSVGGEVFVPQLPSFRIVDLIDVIKEKHQATNLVKTIGIRPGEKIHELMINSSEVSRTFEFNGMYVITSAIEKYIGPLEPAYISQDKRLTEDVMQEYSSAGSLLGKPELVSLFKDLGLL